MFKGWHLLVLNYVLGILLLFQVWVEMVVRLSYGMMMFRLLFRIIPSTALAHMFA